MHTSIRNSCHADDEDVDNGGNDDDDDDEDGDDDDDEDDGDDDDDDEMTERRRKRGIFVSYTWQHLLSVVAVNIFLPFLKCMLEKDCKYCSAN